MEYFSVQAIIFYILFADSVIANVIAWFGRPWYRKNFSLFAQLFPLTRGWAGLYLVLVLFIGYLIFF